MRTKTTIAENREMVLEAIVRCMKDLGVNSVRSADMAHYAGVTTRCISKYFGDKDKAIIDAIIYYMNQNLRELREMSERLLSLSLTGYETAKAFLEYEGEHLLERYDWLMMVREMDVYVRRQTVEVQRKVKKSLQFAMDEELFALAHEVYRRGMEDGSIRADLPLERFVGNLVITMLGGMDRTAAYLYLLPPETAKEKFAVKKEEYVVFCDMILRYIRSNCEH